ncbi:MAG: carbonic anhydrase [Acidobacteria bacterium]|nr:carbonic anhydrase [Acidobacteriota bacterium]
MRTAVPLLFLISAQAVLPADPQHPAPTPEIALDWLKFGNERHQTGKYVHWHQSIERRKEVAARQQPYAIILTCSDSQVPPEILFDQGLGDLYVVRVAANIAGEKELGSIEWAASQLGVPLVVVLGHQHCGVIQSAVSGRPGAGHWGTLLASLSPAIQRAKTQPGDATDNAIRANIDAAIRQLTQSEPVLQPLVAAKKVKITGGYYSVESGAVQWSTGFNAPPLPHAAAPARH